MSWSGCQSTGADIRKYLTVMVSLDRTKKRKKKGNLRLSTCCKATWVSLGRLCWASLDSMKVSGFWGGTMALPWWWEYILPQAGEARKERPVVE